MHRAARASTVVFLSVSTILMITLPIALFYAFWGIGGAIAGAFIALAFWLIMAAQYVRVRRRQNDR